MKPPKAVDPIRCPSVIRRLLEKVEVDADGCWIWTGYRDRKGYGQIKVNGVAQWAHRMSYASFVGPIPEGLTIHHSCRKTGCIHPDCLSTMTIEENASERYKNA